MATTCKITITLLLLLAAAGGVARAQDIPSHYYSDNVSLVEPDEVSFLMPVSAIWTSVADGDPMPTPDDTWRRPLPEEEITPSMMLDLARMCRIETGNPLEWAAIAWTLVNWWHFVQAHSHPKWSFRTILVGYSQVLRHVVSYSPHQAAIMAQRWTHQPEDVREFVENWLAGNITDPCHSAAYHWSAPWARPSFARTKHWRTNGEIEVVQCDVPNAENRYYSIPRSYYGRP